MFYAGNGQISRSTTDPRTNAPGPSAPRVDLAEAPERRKYLHPVRSYIGNLD
jgi:hypothetical protein